MSFFRNISTAIVIAAVLIGMAGLTSQSLWAQTVGTMATGVQAESARGAFRAGDPEKIDLNHYYRFPLSMGVFYQPLSGMGGSELSDFSIQEISGEFRASFRKVPTIQPFLRGGVIDYSFIGDIEEVNQDWSHRHIYAGAGLGYSTRISGEFEVGADAFAGASQSYFSKLEGPGVDGTMGQLNLVAGGSVRLALNPSYKVSIGVTPSVRYVRGLGSLDSYNGFSFGVGFGVNYRLGQDPDSAQSLIRALRFLENELPPVFAAMQKYYTHQPIGSIRIRNSEKHSITDIDIAFMQEGFMDSPTPVLKIEELSSGEEVEVPVRASFNDRVFTTQGVSPLTGELIVQYVARNRPVEQRATITYMLHDKNALTWDDDRKAAAFITPQDSAVRNYASFIRQAHRESTKPYLSENLQFAMQAYQALAELGIMYQIDPTSPFTEVRENSVVVDSISLPRETLLRLTGDCDDLTVLYNTILQTVGIETALVTIPGHIYSAVNTGIPAAQYGMVHPDRNMTIALDGELWVPVEITLIGSAGFMEAWNTGVTEYREHDANPGARGFYRTPEAQKLFSPVVLRETDLGLQYGDAEAMARVFSDELDRLAGTILGPQRDAVREKNSPQAWNRYGITAAKLGSYSVAEEAFETALRLDGGYTGARVNLGSLYFLQEKYDRAARSFEQAVSKIRREAADKGSEASRKFLSTVTLNLSKVYYAQEEYEKAREQYQAARELGLGKAAGYAYLAAGSTKDDASTAPAIASAESSANKPGNQSGQGLGRASGAAEAEPILFVEE